jgi:hypothetical protein
MTDTTTQTTAAAPAAGPADAQSAATASIPSVPAAADATVDTVTDRIHALLQELEGLKFVSEATDALHAAQRAVYSVFGYVETHVASIEAKAKDDDAVMKRMFGTDEAAAGAAVAGIDSALLR